MRHLSLSLRPNTLKQAPFIQIFVVSIGQENMISCRPKRNSQSHHNSTSLDRLFLLARVWFSGSPTRYPHFASKLCARHAPNHQTHTSQPAGHDSVASTQVRVDYIARYIYIVHIVF